MKIDKLYLVIDIDANILAIIKITNHKLKCRVEALNKEGGPKVHFRTFSRRIQACKELGQATTLILRCRM